MYCIYCCGVCTVVQSFLCIDNYCISFFLFKSNKLIYNYFIILNSKHKTKRNETKRKQVNPHVVPFLQHTLAGGSGKAAQHSPGTLVSHSALKATMRYLDHDLRHRTLTLAEMGLLPRWYGQDVTKMLKQNYRGDVTIVPELKIDESLGIKAVMNPTEDDMVIYLRDGRRACWPHLLRIKHLLSVESCLHTHLESLLQDAHGLKAFGIKTAFDLTTNHGMVGMGLGLSDGSWGQEPEGEGEGGRGGSDRDSGGSNGGGGGSVDGSGEGGSLTRAGAAKARSRPRTTSVTAQFDIEHQTSVSDFLIFQRQKQDIKVGDMTDSELKQKILDLENEALTYKSALAKRQEADKAFTSFYY
jgi:uncharacterized membrane protein YgcG